MNAPRLVLPLVLLSLAVSCGGPDVRGTIDQFGGRACVPSSDPAKPADKVCLVVAAEALDAPISVRISPLADPPTAAVGDAWEITATGKPSLVFRSAAQVVYSTDWLPMNSLPSPNLLRVYRRSDAGEWESLENVVLDRVKNELGGDTLELGAFVVMRVDRLPDGGIPVEGDGGRPRDSGVIIIPPVPDAGRPDAGRPDSGTPDAGPTDAGPSDAGPTDAGPTDAGPDDAGLPDAGPPDAGSPDAGPPDAGPPDAGPPDAGPLDAGPLDAGDPDAGAPDAGGLDGGDGG